MKTNTDQIYQSIAGQRFTPRLPTHFQMEYRFTIYAVGITVESALKVLATSLNWGEIKDIEWQPVDVPCEWYVRFTTDDGTSMKAAGQYLTGGVIVTWWK